MGDSTGSPEFDRAELERARAHLAAIVASSEDAIVSKTLDGIVTSWNATAERLFGYTADEMIGQPILRLIPEHLHHEEVDILAKLRAGQRIERYETIRMRKDGGLLDISLTISPVRDSSGKIVGAAKIAHDITRRRAAEQAVKEEAAALEALHRVGQAVASQLDLERIVQIVTDAATEQTGASFGAFFYNVANASGESYWLYALSGAPREAFARFPMPRNTEVFSPTFRGEGVVRSGDIRSDPRYGKNAPYIGMPPGHLPVCSYLAVAVKSRSGEVFGGLFFGHPEPGRFTERTEQLVVGVAAQAAIAIDNARLYQAAKAQIANRERMADSLRDTDRRKDEFLATLAHELRNPLASLGNALNAQALAARADPLHEAMQRQLRLLVRLIDDLLDIARINRGKLTVQHAPTTLGAVLDSAI